MNPSCLSCTVVSGNNLMIIIKKFNTEVQLRCWVHCLLCPWLLLCRLPPIQSFFKPIYCVTSAWFVWWFLKCLFKTWPIPLIAFNPFYPEYDSSRSYPFYPEYDSSRSLHLTRLPCTLTFWNPIGWLTPNDVSISGSLGNSYFSTNQCRSVGICSSNRVPPS